MNLKNSTAEIWVPDELAVLSAIGRTTHMGISAHQDDLEIMAYEGILNCFGLADKWFMGVVVTNGSGSPRDDLYKDYTDVEMQAIRRKEQKKAACVGEYGSIAMLDYGSSTVKDGKNEDVKNDLKELLIAAQPEVVYTHNFADKHDTHVAVTLRLINALRELPVEMRPKQVLGCEVWRDLDWMTDSDKVPMDVSAHENLAAALLGVFDSQICGGKRYDIATMGRRRAHATYYSSHGVDTTTHLNFAMDLTGLVEDSTLNVEEFIQSYIDRFANEVQARLAKLSG